MTENRVQFVGGARDGGTTPRIGNEYEGCVYLDVYQAEGKRSTNTFTEAVALCLSEHSVRRVTAIARAST
ncbi:MAG: hypothetical protein KGL39_34550 [Patescibacteria group bacterium]|nr:hypothetical protein [Patescibacteria group bacterium]